MEEACASIHKQNNTDPIEPLCQSIYQLISVSSNEKTVLQCEGTGQILICRLLTLLNIQDSVEKQGEGGLVEG